MRVLGVAQAGQHANDLEVKYAGQRVFIEIKGVKNARGGIVLLEKSVRRNKVPPEIEKVTAAMARGCSVGGARLADLMKALNLPFDFMTMMDFFREHVDPSVGLSEDANSPPSGKLPKELQSTSRSVTAAVRKIIVDKLVKEENSYLAIHDKDTDEVYLYHTGLGQNPVGADPIPAFTKVKMDTYGGSSKGATRVAVKSSMILA